MLFKHYSVDCLSCREYGRAVECIIYLLCSLLASGSDDVQVIIWDPFRKKQLTTIRTGHNGNIFSVKVCILAACLVVVL